MAARGAPCRVADGVLNTYRPLYERLTGGFLLPRGYPGHAHDWVQLDTGYCVCALCGDEHVCFRGGCPVSESDACEQVCTVTGCVVSCCEMRPEFGALDRVQQPRHHHHRRGPPTECKRGVDLPDFVEMVVREILDSGKTQACEDEERLRDHNKRASALGRILREGRNGISLVEVEARLAWACRKCRSRPRREPAVVQRVVGACVDGICSLLQKHGWQRVTRQLQHNTRGREFICSMLYLMRMGITFKDRCLLQRIDTLHALLPLQVFLPTVFGIRAKSITEGENIIKLDIRHMPL